MRSFQIAFPSYKKPVSFLKQQLFHLTPNFDLFENLQTIIHRDSKSIQVFCHSQNPYFEHVLSFEGNHNPVAEEDALHIIRRAEITMGRGILEFVANLELLKDTLWLRRSLWKLYRRPIKFMDTVREYSISLSKLNDIFELCSTGERY